MTENKRIWNRDFSLLWLTNFNMALGFYFLIPTLPIYSINVLGADTGQVGYIVGVYTLAALLIRPLAGYALDLWGRKKLYLFALGTFALLMAAYPLAKSLLLLLIIRFLHGLSWGVTTTSAGTIVADLVPQERRGEGIGYFGLTMTIAMALGPLMGLWIMGDSEFSRLFLASGILMIFAFMLAQFIKTPTISLQKKSLSWGSFFEKRVLHLSLVLLFTTLVYGGIVSFIIIYSDSLGIQNGGIFFLVYAVSLSLIRPYAGKLLDKKGPKLVVTFGYLFLILGFLALASSKNTFLFVVSASIIGIGNGMVWPTLQTMIINVVEPHRRGVASSTYMSALDLGIGGGSITLGFLAKGTSLSTMFFISGLFLILPLTYFFLYTLKDYNAKMSALKTKV